MNCIPCSTNVYACRQATRKELYEKYKNVWQNLNDNKKLKYIKMAIEAKKKYDVCLAFFSHKTLQLLYLTVADICVCITVSYVVFCLLILCLVNFHVLHLSEY